MRRAAECDTPLRFLWIVHRNPGVSVSLLTNISPLTSTSYFDSPFLGGAVSLPPCDLREFLLISAPSTPKMELSTFLSPLPDATLVILSFVRNYRTFFSALLSCQDTVTLVKNPLLWYRALLNRIPGFPKSFDHCIDYREQFLRLGRIRCVTNIPFSIEHNTFTGLDDSEKDSDYLYKEIDYVIPLVAFNLGDGTEHLIREELQNIPADCCGYEDVLTSSIVLSTYSGRDKVFYYLYEFGREYLASKGYHLSPIAYTYEMLSSLIQYGDLGFFWRFIKNRTYFDYDSEGFIIIPSDQFGYPLHGVFYALVKRNNFKVFLEALSLFREPHQKRFYKEAFFYWYGKRQLMVALINYLLENSQEEILRELIVREALPLDLYKYLVEECHLIFEFPQRPPNIEEMKYLLSLNWYPEQEIVQRWFDATTANRETDGTREWFIKEYDFLTESVDLVRAYDRAIILKYSGQAPKLGLEALRYNLTRTDIAGYECSAALRAWVDVISLQDLEREIRNEMFDLIVGSPNLWFLIEVFFRKENFLSVNDEDLLQLGRALLVIPPHGTREMIAISMGVLLEAGLDPNFDEGTPLRYVFTTGVCGMIHKIMKFGGDLSRFDPEWIERTVKGLTGPLVRYDMGIVLSFLHREYGLKEIKL